MGISLIRATPLQSVNLVSTSLASTLTPAVNLEDVVQSPIELYSMLFSTPDCLAACALKKNYTLQDFIDKYVVAERHTLTFLLDVPLDIGSVIHDSWTFLDIDISKFKRDYNRRTQQLSGELFYLLILSNTQLKPWREQLGLEFQTLGENNITALSARYKGVEKITLLELSAFIGVPYTAIATHLRKYSAMHDSFKFGNAGIFDSAPSGTGGYVLIEKLIEYVQDMQHSTPRNIAIAEKYNFFLNRISVDKHINTPDVSQTISETSPVSHLPVEVAEEIVVLRKLTEPNYATHPIETMDDFSTGVSSLSVCDHYGSQKRSLLSTTDVLAMDHDSLGTEHMYAVKLPPQKPKPHIINTVPSPPAFRSYGPGLIVINGQNTGELSGFR